MPSAAVLLDWLPLLNLAAAAGMMAVLWVVQLAVYPLFDGIGEREFAGYHRRYSTGIAWVVGPLMLVEGAATLGSWALGTRDAAFVGASLLLAAGVAMTALVQVPLHGRLGTGFHADSHRRLVRSNWLRTAAWTLRVALLVFSLRGGR